MSECRREMEGNGRIGQIEWKWVIVMVRKWNGMGRFRKVESSLLIQKFSHAYCFRYNLSVINKVASLYCKKIAAYFKNVRK